MHPHIIWYARSFKSQACRGELLLDDMASVIRRPFFKPILAYKDYCAANTSWFPEDSTGDTVKNRNLI